MEDHGSGEVNYVWQTGLGWTEDNMKTFHRREFRAADDGVIASAAQSYANRGDIRRAAFIMSGIFPSALLPQLATRTVAQLEV